MKFALIDDEEFQLENLHNLLIEYASVNAINIETDSFRSGEEFLNGFAAFSYDIIFIDIYMHGITGVETAKKIRESDTRSIIIFITSSMEYMADAFSCHAFDYIEKPISRKHLFKALTDALGVLPRVENSLSFTYNGLDIKVPSSDFVYLTTRGHNTEIVDINGEHYSPYVTYKAMSEQLLSDTRFLQINKCVLVNMDFIVRFDDKSCIMVDNAVLPVNIRNVKAIEQSWRNYMFLKLHQKLEGGTKE